MTSTTQPMKTGTLLATDVTRRWLGEVPVYILCVALGAVCVILLALHQITPSVSGIIENARLFLLFTSILIIFDAAWQLNRQRPDRPTRFLVERYFNRTLHTQILAGLPLILLAIVILPMFSKMKSAIPLFNEFTWDATFIEWDQALFFGYDAWEVMQPVLGYPIITATLALLYHLWFLLLYPGVMFFVFYRMDSGLRRQFFLSYALSWSLIGGALATLFASVGPCFLEPMMGDAHFSDQMAYLYKANETVPIMVLPVQEMLLEWHGGGQNGLGSGITAMPSMHVAIAFLYWLAVRRIHRGWGTAFGVFFAITWISSVHLAYHYAVDGLISIIAVAAIWKFSQILCASWDGWMVRRSGDQATLRTNTVPAE